MNLYRVSMDVWQDDDDQASFTEKVDVVAEDADYAIAAARDLIQGRKSTWADDDGTEQTSVNTKARMSQCRIVSSGIDAICVADERYTRVDGVWDLQCR